MENKKKNNSNVSWWSVIGLMFATFIFNTSEFIPIGLLSGIATDFGITESHAGMMITEYAWVVAVASLPLMLAFAKTENKKLMLSVFFVFILSQIASGFASDFYLLMISRVGVACAHAIFWSIVTPYAVKLAPEGKQSTALSLIITGSSVAMIVGLPLGRAIGLAVGWRTTFLILGATSASICILLAILLKKLPGESSFSLRNLPALLKNPALISIYLLTVIVITGHFTAYSYIEPFLLKVSGFEDDAVTMILALFGVVGIAGSMIFSKLYDRKPIVFIAFSVTFIAVSLLMLHLSSFSKIVTLIMCVIWGLAINFYNLVFQSELMRVAPRGTSVAMSIYSGIYNIGIGGGALLGGYVCSGLDISFIGYAGGIVAMSGVFFCIVKVMQLLRSARFGSFK